MSAVSRIPSTHRRAILLPPNEPRMSASPTSLPVAGWRTIFLLNRYHWFVFTVAALGWLADCMDQQLFVLLRQRAAASLLGLPC